MPFGFEKPKVVLQSSRQTSSHGTFDGEVMLLEKHSDGEGKSEVSFSIEKIETPKITIENADGNKCSRCWKILPEVEPEGLCNRCEDIVKIYCS